MQNNWSILCERCGEHWEYLNTATASATVNTHHYNCEGPPHMTEQPKNDQLTTEWAKLARAEIDQTIPKATEYGQQSLINLGNQLAQLQGRQVTDPEAMELACWSYLNGKLQRFNDAVINGKQVSDDTLLDIGVYVRMIQIIRKTGNWVGQ